MNSDVDVEDLHTSWSDPPVAWLPKRKVSSYAEQLITLSIDSAMNDAADEDPSASGSFFPWDFVETHSDLLEDLARRTALTVDECLTFLGSDLVGAIQKKNPTPDQQRLHLNLKSLNPQLLLALATGIVIDGEAVVRGIRHGPTKPPWDRAGPGAPVVDQFAMCLHGLTEYEPNEFSAEPVQLIPMAWAAYVEPTVLCAPANVLHPRIHNGVITSAISVAHGSVQKIKREVQARQTWKKCRQLGDELVKIKEIQIPDAARREMERLFADEHPNSANVHRVMKVTKDLIKPAWQKHVEETRRYPIEWDKSWGEYPINLLEGLRNAGAKSVETATLNEIVDRPPSKIVQEMIAVHFDFDGDGSVAIFDSSFDNDGNRALHAAFQLEIRRRKSVSLPITGVVRFG